MTAENQNNVAHTFLTAEFPDNEVKQFNQAKQGQPARWLSYVEDETVMDRLDLVMGPGHWSITVDAVNSTVARVTLSVKWPDNETWTSYSDFGYPTNGERGEALKEAVSDGIRRCGRYLGIARYIYAGEAPAHIPTPAPARQQQRPAPQQRPTSEPWNGDDMEDIDQDEDENTCSKHGDQWRGEPYNGDYKSGRYHKAGENDEGKAIWCRHPGDDAAKQANKKGR